MSQFWRDLAFLHWFVRAGGGCPSCRRARRRMWCRTGGFAGLTPVALVPFRMVGAGFGNGRRCPYFGTFWETNVRLYSVDATGRHGVVFCSLDASRLAVVLGARAALGLPYRFSADARVRTRHRRARANSAGPPATRWPGPRGVSSRVVVRVGAVLHDFRPAAATDGQADLAAFLTARWGLHTAALGRSLFIPNEHEPWTLRSAEVLLLDDGLLAAAGFPGLADRPPDHVCFAEGVRTRSGCRSGCLPGTAGVGRAASAGLRQTAAPPHPSGMWRRRRRRPDRRSAVTAVSR